MSKRTIPPSRRRSSPVIPLDDGTIATLDDYRDCLARLSDAELANEVGSIRRKVDDPVALVFLAEIEQRLRRTNV